MTEYRYTDCGLDNVMIAGVKMILDDADDEVVCIPNVNGLHKAIAESILARKSSMSGAELKFIRTEMGLTQAQLAGLVHREPLAISRWERGESPLDSNAEALIRLHALEALEISARPTVKDVSNWCVPSASQSPIQIDGSDTSNYRPLAA